PVAARADQVVLAVADHQRLRRVQVFFGQQVRNQLHLVGARTVQLAAVDDLEMPGKIEVPGNLAGELPGLGGGDVQRAPLRLQPFEQLAHAFEHAVLVQPGEERAFLVGQRPCLLHRAAHVQEAALQRLARRYQAAGTDDHLVLDHRAVHDGAAHADQNAVAQGAAMQHDLVANGHVIADQQRVAVGIERPGMDGAVFLLPRCLTVSANNPLLQSYDLPPFSAIRAEHVLPAIEQILADNRSAIASILKTQGQNPTWAGLAYEALIASPEAAGFDVAQKTILEHALRDFRLSGIDLPADQQKRYAE
uniref:ABC transporter substrate-binding protein n=1 Tax=Steinernema glaseri TaxID=37863 RepID=A0A1I8AQ18_9BILA